MRISDWSSDVCSSDLEAIPVEQSVTARDRPRLALKRLVTAAIQTVGLMNRLALARNVHNAHHVHMGCCASDRNATPRSERVVEGKSVSVRVGLGGRSIITKKKRIIQYEHQADT